MINKLLPLSPGPLPPPAGHPGQHPGEALHISGWDDESTGKKVNGSTSQKVDSTLMSL